MRKISVFIFLIVSALSVFSGSWVKITGSVPVAARTSLISSTVNNSIIRVTLDGFNLVEVQTPRGPAFCVSVGDATPILEAGAPDLPKVTASLVIPDQAGMSIRLVSSSFVDYPDMMIAPSKGVIMRDVDPSDVPFQYGRAYSDDAFFPGSFTGTREPFIIRDVRGQTVIAYPFQYNPVTKILRVYYDLTIELYQTSDNGINPLGNSAGIKKLNPDFLSICRSQFLNLDAMNYIPLNEYGNLLVISHGPYMEAMQPYVAWKRAAGYHTEMIHKDSAGTTATQIRAYIADYYNTKGLTHVLLVGDAPQVPTNTGGGLGGPSDNAYGYVVGNDHYSDVFIGRFSAETEAHVQTQVQRTLEYEQDPQHLTDDWFTNVIGIASNQGPGDDNEMDYEHIRNQQSQLLSYTYTWNPEFFDGSQGGNDAAGNPSPLMVAAEVNNGSGLMLYTGHGSKTAWSTSGFSNSNVNQLTNQGKLPFIWSVACVNGEFMTGGPCFAEAWMRATSDGQPTGAIAFLGSTINQSWNSPMEGQDEMTDILAESYTDNIKRSFAGISMNGCMKMIETYGTDGRNMADTWTVFGDPTVMVRTAVPQLIAVQYDTMLFVNDTMLSLYCEVEGARVTATLADTILATALIADSTALLTFPALTIAFDTIRLVVTAYNMIPFQGDLIIRDIPLPVVAGFTGVPNRVIPGQSVAFADTSLGNTTTWKWQFPGGIPEESDEQNPVVTYETVGTYDVKLIVGDGYSSDSLLMAGYIVADFPAYVSDHPGDFNCTVVPNPGRGNFRLNISSSRAGLAEISVYDMIGSRLFHEKGLLVAGNTVKSIDLTSKPEGVYFLKISGDHGMTTRKLIIRR